MNIKTILTLLLLISCFAINSTAETIENSIRLHVIYSEKLQDIMHKLSLSVYSEEPGFEEIDKLYDNASELYLAAKELDQALPGFNLTPTEKSIFENIARQLQVEANNMGYMAKNNNKEGLQMTYDRLTQTCVACHDLFRY